MVSGAAGAVGMLVGQIAKIRECQVLGLADRGEGLVARRDELGFDAAINYKATTSLEDELQRLCPDGVDVYFDNVGGSVTDTIVPRINAKARIAVCGRARSTTSSIPRPARGGSAN